jgi:hypothetical protein
MRKISVESGWLTDKIKQIAPKGAKIKWRAMNEDILDNVAKNNTAVACWFTAYNTRMPGGQSATQNCRFDASVTVHSLRSGGVMSAMPQLRACRERCAHLCLNSSP